MLYLEAEISCHTGMFSLIDAENQSLFIYFYLLSGKIIGREGDLEQAQKIIRQYDEVNLLGPEKVSYCTKLTSIVRRFLTD